ncbi:MAG: hypothetical protein V3573_14505 [Desulfovibrionaceae bacterium]
MRMLKHTITGRLYVYHEGLAEAENIEVVQVDQLPEAEAQTPVEPPMAPTPPMLTGEGSMSLFDESPVGLEWDGQDQEPPVMPKSLDEMTRDELIAMANAEEKLRGDNRNLSRLKKADLIAYIKGEGA